MTKQQWNQCGAKLNKPEVLGKHVIINRKDSILNGEEGRVYKCRPSDGAVLIYVPYNRKRGVIVSCSEEECIWISKA